MATTPALTFKVKNPINMAQAKADLAYNPSDLTSAMMSQASMFAHYGVLSAEAAKQVDDIELTIETAEAKVSRDIRDQATADGVKLTEGGISAEVAKHPKILALKKALNEAKQIAASAKTLVEGFRQRRDMLVSHGLISREEMKGELSIAAKKIHEDEQASQTKRALDLVQRFNPQS